MGVVSSRKWLLCVVTEFRRFLTLLLRASGLAHTTAIVAGGGAGPPLESSGKGRGIGKAAGEANFCC